MMIENFNYNKNKCKKCGSDVISKQYKPAFIDNEVIKSPEYLLITCCSCGYIWRTRTKDDQ